MVYDTQAAITEVGGENIDSYADELVLQICSPTRRGQIVRLKSHKCSIGSARNCTLRLAAGGIHPVHCLIARGRNATVIRCWAPDTLLNGRAFSDANLNVGDHLTVGPIEFEVLHTASPETPETPETVPTQLSPDAEEQLLRLSAEQESFQRDKQLWEKDSAAQLADLERCRAELESQRLELESKHAEIESKQAEFESQKNEIDALRQSLQSERDVLSEQAESLKKERQAWLTAREEEQSQAAEEKARLERLREELESARAENPLEAEIQEAPIKEEPPVNLESILGKMGLAKTFAEDETPQPADSESMADRQTGILRKGQKAETTSGMVADSGDLENEDESLNDYMARLMERVRSVSDSTSTESLSAPAILNRGWKGAEKTYPTPPTQQLESAKASADTSQAPEAPAQPSKPRGVAPEKAENLSAMRELANVSAKTAIERHAKRQFSHAARSKLLVAGVALLSGGILFFLWQLIGDRGLFFFSGLIAFIVALYWGFEYFTMSGETPKSWKPNFRSQKTVPKE